MDWSPDYWLPLVFAGLMALAMLVYVVLDGYDLGVGVLLFDAERPQQDRMIASIGPFWDANETWLVLGVGILLTAFPMAHGIILTALYLPVFLMLAGLILRGVAFDFRVKARAHHQIWWTRAFMAGSFLAAFSQGLMLGHYITGFANDGLSWLFAQFVGIALVAGYALLGAGWVIYKTEGPLQQKAFAWAHRALWLTAVGIALVSLITPLVSERIFAKWFTDGNLLWLAPIPLLTLALFITLERLLRRARQQGRVARDWQPFALSGGIFILAFIGLGYSLFPYVIMDEMTLWEAAAAPNSLMFMLVGAIVVLPAILGYTWFSYRVFRGKAEALSYD